MKKVIISVLSAALLLMGTQAKAQLSVGAGYLNSAETTTNTSNNSTSSANLNGFYAGANFNIAIAGELGVAPGLYASMLFGSSKEGGSLGPISASGVVKYSEFALNLPVNVNYGIKLNRDTKILLYAGPVFQYGLSSKTETSGTTNVGGLFSIDSNGTTDNYNGDYANRNPFTIYVGGGAALQAGNLQVILGYDHSVTNISKATNTQLGRSQLKVGFGMAF